ncbi:MAG: tetratricopeptide repeat protein [Pseudomonadota bacterium]
MWPLPNPNANSDALRAFGWLLLAVCLAYANTLGTPFQFDDYKVIVHFPGVHSWDAWREGLTHGIRPLLKASYTLDWTLGLGVTGFHLSNLAIHLLNGWLVYRLTQHYCAHHAGLPASLPLFVALLFVLHPAHSEAVSYISGRSSSLMTLFYLLGLLAYTRGRQQTSALHLHLLTPLCFVAALLCKETAVTFPFALLLWERFALNNHTHAFKQNNPLEREPVIPAQAGIQQDNNASCSSPLDGRSSKLADGSFSGLRRNDHANGRSGFKAQWTSWAMLLAAALLFLFSETFQSHMLRSAQFNTLSGNLATQANGMLWMLQQWLLPLWLNIDPNLPLYRSASAAQLPVLAMLILGITAWWLRKQRPWWSFALAWAMLQLLPLYVLLPRLDIANERQLYLVGWPLALALCIELSSHLNARTARIAMLALLLATALLTAQRNLDYRSEITLWQATAQQSPNKARVHNNLGYAWLLAGNNDEARREFQRALQLDPQHAEAAGNLRRLENTTPGAMPGVQ